MTHSVSPHSRSYPGAFVLTLDETQNFHLAGIPTSPSETLVRLGILPDNHLLANKLIRIFGRRALQLLKKQSATQERADNSLWCQTVADETELFAIWQFIDILSALKPLEQLTGVMEKPDAEKIRANVLQKIRDKKNSPNTYRIMHNANSPDTDLIRKLKKSHEALLKKCEALLKKGSLDNPLQQRHLYQELLKQFEAQQTLIGAHQRELFSLFSIANDTNTNATQNAFYAVQEHVFTAETCTPAQLWIKGNNAEKLTLDTTHYPSIREEDALFAASLLEASPTPGFKEPHEILQNAHTEFDKNHKAIKEKHIKFKNQIDDIRLAHTHWYTPWDYLQARLGLYRDSAVSDAFAAQELKGSYGWDLAHRLSTLFQRKHTQLHAKLRELFKPKTSTETETTAAFARELPVHQYVPSDLFSALNSFGYELFQYFSRELAAKHPMVTTSSFIIPGTYFTAIALEGLKIAPHVAHAIYSTLSKILSADGHLLDPEKINLAFTQATKAWLHVTGASGTIDTLLLSSVGGPKISFFVGDALTKILTGTDQNVITEISRQISHGHLDVNSLCDDAREITKQILTNASMLTAAVLLGISAPMLANVPALKGLALFISFFDRIKVESFNDLLNEHGADQAMAFAEVLTELKVASLFLAKIFAIKHFARKQLPPADMEALTYFTELRHKPRAKANAEAAFNRHQLALEKLIALQPALKQELGVAFLNEHGIRDYYAAPGLLHALYVFIQKLVGTVNTLVVGAAALVPSMLYLAFTSRKQVPESEALRYCLKQSTKLLYVMQRLVASVFYVVKFLPQALGGFALRTVVAALSVIAAILIVGVTFGERLWRNGVVNALHYLGVKLIKSLYMPVHLFESVGYAASMLLIPLTLSVIAIAAALTKGAKPFREKFHELFSRFRQHHHELSAACRNLDIHFMSGSADPVYSQKLQIPLYHALASISLLGIQLKNALGLPIAWLRDQSLRRLSYRLQVIEHKNNEAMYLVPTVKHLEQKISTGPSASEYSSDSDFEAPVTGEKPTQISRPLTVTLASSPDTMWKGHRPSTKNEAENKIEQAQHLAQRDLLILGGFRPAA